MAVPARVSIYKLSINQNHPRWWRITSQHPQAIPRQSLGEETVVDCFRITSQHPQAIPRQSLGEETVVDCFLLCGCRAKSTASIGKESVARYVSIGDIHDMSHDMFVY
jgi:hypothetical protein